MKREELFKELQINEKRYLKFLGMIIKQKIDSLVSATIYFKETKKIVSFEIISKHQILKIDCVDEVEMEE